MLRFLRMRVTVYSAAAVIYGCFVRAVWHDPNITALGFLAFTVAPIAGGVGFYYLRKWEISCRSGDLQRDSAFAIVLWLSVAIAVIVICAALLVCFLWASTSA